MLRRRWWARIPAASSWPPYVGNKGWIGARLGAVPDWEELAELIEESYRLIAPKRLAALLDGAERGRPRDRDA